MTGTAAVSNAAAGWVENQRAVLRAARRRAPHAADSSRIDKMVRRTTHAPSLGLPFAPQGRGLAGGWLLEPLT